MKDMFVNYDNNINKKLLPPHLPFNEAPNILESLDNIAIVYDVFGNEIGIRVKHNTAFTFYLYLSGFVKGSSIDELVSNSQLAVRVFGARNKIVLEKIFNAADSYCSRHKYLAIEITRSEAELLNIDSYRLNISLEWPGGYYELYTENDGLLIVR